MKHMLLALVAALVFAGAGCSKYEVYERNLTYFTPETLQQEQAAAAQQLEAAQAELARAQTSGDPERLAKAQLVYNGALHQTKIVDKELRRRERGW